VCIQIPDFATDSPHRAELLGPTRIGSLRSRAIEQEILDLLDEPRIRLADLGLAAKTRPVVIVSLGSTNPVTVTSPVITVSLRAGNP
jgi:hypothetical protein